MIKLGATMRFKPNGTSDRNVLVCTGTVIVYRQLTPDEVDEEVGPMFEVRNIFNSLSTSAFADELHEIDG